MAVMNDMFKEARMAVLGRPKLEHFDGHWRIVLRQWREPHLFNDQPYDGPYGKFYWIKEEVIEWMTENTQQDNKENTPYVSMEDSGHRFPDNWMMVFPNEETAFAFKMRWL